VSSTVRCGLVLAAATAACSNAPTTPGGVAGLEVHIPFPAVVDFGDTITLRAKAIDGIADSGTASVQAQSGPYITDLIPFTVRPSADTLAIVPPDTFRVALADSESAPLVATVLSNNPPGGLSGRNLIYTVVFPVFSDPSARTVQLPGGVLADTIATGFDGGPVSPVTLRRVPGVATPDNALVEISTFRPSGKAVPGSGQRFTVRFDNP